jgi:dTDP-4-amino-4,6-dideoxygalactose transaminase
MNAVETTQPASVRTAPPLVEVPFLDLGALHEPMGAEMEQCFRTALRTGDFIGGDAVARFESRFAEYLGRRHCVGVANGTDALELVLRGLDIGPGDEVIVPTNTFVATAEAIVAAGAHPHFVDVDPGTLLMRPESVAGAVSARTAAVIVVHLFGEAADVVGLAAVAERAGIALIEDAAQAHGAAWDGRPIGSNGVASCFSFYPGKNLGAFGDGGAVATDDADLADRIRCLANHGRAVNGGADHAVVGRNSRLDSLQAAFLTVKLGHLDTHNERRRAAARQYDEALASCDAVRLLERNHRSAGVHHLYPVEVSDRDRVREELGRRGIATGIHYPVPCHRLGGYTAYSPGVLPYAERAAARLLSLPISPTITSAQIDWVGATLRDVVGGGGR